MEIEHPGGRHFRRRHQHQYRRRLAGGGRLGRQPHPRLTPADAAAPIRRRCIKFIRQSLILPVRPLVRRAMRYMIGSEPSRERRVRPCDTIRLLPPQCETMLERILSSETFKRSERARSLLAYLVEREQARRGRAPEGLCDRRRRLRQGCRVRFLDRCAGARAGGAAARAARPILRRPKAAAIRSASSFRAAAMCRPTRTCPTERTTQMSSEALAQSCGSGGRQCRGAAARPAGRTSRRRRSAASASGQVRLLWGALAFVARPACRRRLSHRACPAAGSDEYRRCAGNGDADRGHPRAVAAEALPTIRIVAESDDAGDVSASLADFKTAFAGFDTLDLIDSEFCRSATHASPDPDELCADGRVGADDREACASS